MPTTEDTLIDLKGFGEWVQRQRTIRGMTQRQLADLSGISKGYISQLESGHAKGVKTDTMYALASHLLDDQSEINREIKKFIIAPYYQNPMWLYGAHFTPLDQIEEYIQQLLKEAQGFAELSQQFAEMGRQRKMEAGILSDQHSHLKWLKTSLGISQSTSNEVQGDVQEEPSPKDKE